MLRANLINIILGVVLGALMGFLHIEGQSLTAIIEPEPIIEEVPTTAPAETEEDILEEEYYDDLELLALCVEAEAGNQSFYGKQLVVDVILNRVESPDFPDTIREVILQQNQFSVVLFGTIWEMNPAQSTYDAIQMELNGPRQNTEILFFASNGYISCGTPWQKVGDHYFSTK